VESHIDQWPGGEADKKFSGISVQNLTTKRTLPRILTLLHKVKRAWKGRDEENIP
jgi:hypothetical protein